MSWNNITPWWLLELDSILEKVGDGELSYGSAIDQMEEASVPDVIIKRWCQQWDIPDGY